MNGTVTRFAAFGAIALAFVKAAHAEPGTELAVEGLPALVKSLPFIDSLARS